MAYTKGENIETKNTTQHRERERVYYSHVVFTRYDEALVVTDRVLSSRSEEGGGDGVSDIVRGRLLVTLLFSATGLLPRRLPR